MVNSDETGEGESPKIQFLTKHQILRLHQRVIERYSPGEPLDIISPDYLESALIQPQQTWGGNYVYQTLADKASAYLVCFACNHVFLQGNKRVAFAACSVFLRMNGYRLALSDEEATSLTLSIAQHELNREQAAEILAGAIEVMQ